MPPVDETISIRQARREDAAAVTAITLAAYHKYIARLGRQPRPMTDDYQRLIADHPVWVACAGERLVGVLVLMTEPEAMLIYSVAVAPDYQKQGLGRRLLALAEEQARVAGYRRIRLYTDERMVENIALYRRLGYDETGREPVGNTSLVRMAKPLH